MAQPYVGEIRMFGGNFAPLGWMFCAGQLLPISEYETLFNLIGTTYGGDGQETFALPNMQGRIPVHMGTNAGTTYQLGETYGVESVTLNIQQIPRHNHMMACNGQAAGAKSPNGAFLGRNASTDGYSNDTSAGLQPLYANAIAPVGGSQPHDNMAPFLCVSYIISLFGIFPSQS